MKTNAGSKSLAMDATSNPTTKGSEICQNWRAGHDCTLQIFIRDHGMQLDNFLQIKGIDPTWRRK